MKRIMSNRRAFAIMDNFSRSRVLVIGDIMADHFIWGKVSRISPEAPVPVVEVKKDHFTLGGCANLVGKNSRIERVFRRQSRAMLGIVAVDGWLVERFGKGRRRRSIGVGWTGFGQNGRGLRSC